MHCCKSGRKVSVVADRPSLFGALLVLVCAFSCRINLQNLPAELMRSIVLALFILPACPVNAQSTETSFQNPCSIQIPRQSAMQITCRWMMNARSNKPIFVDNNLTGARYEVGNGWRVLDDDCIISTKGVKVCRLDE